MAFLLDFELLATQLVRVMWLAPDRRAAFLILSLYHNGLPRRGKNADKDFDLGAMVHYSDGSRNISTDSTGVAPLHEKLVLTLFTNVNSLHT